VTGETTVRALDEVAAAIQEARRRAPWAAAPSVVSAFGLFEQFGGPVTAEQWAAIAVVLGCPLPPLEFVQGHWLLPSGFETIWDLVDLTPDCHPDWEPPAARTVEAWREAQVFTRVRTALVDALAVDEYQVNRSTRIRDLI
jgi:hypothetical protein